MTIRGEVRNVVVVHARCSRTRKGFGIRYEEVSPLRWVATWAFPITETRAKREGYDQEVIEGSFENGKDYLGCPSCWSPGFVKCSCGKIGCWNGESMTYTCPSCNTTGQLGGSVDSLTSGGDR